MVSVRFLDSGSRSFGRSGRELLYCVRSREVVESLSLVVSMGAEEQPWAAGAASGQEQLWVVSGHRLRELGLFSLGIPQCY